MGLNLELDIEELILYGFPTGVRYRICEALTQEMTRLLAQDSLSLNFTGSNHKVDALDFGSFQFTQRAKPEEIGVKIAQTIYEGLNQL